MSQNQLENIGKSDISKNPTLCIPTINLMVDTVGNFLGACSSPEKIIKMFLVAGTVASKQSHLY